MWELELRAKESQHSRAHRRTMNSPRILLVLLGLVGFRWFARAGQDPCGFPGQRCCVSGQRMSVPRGRTALVCSSTIGVNYSGKLIFDGAKNLQDGEAKCCASCSATSGCSVWVYCSNVGGCDNGSGGNITYKACALKYQSPAQLASGQPESYPAVDNYSFTSGFLLNTSGNYSAGAVSIEQHANYYQEESSNTKQLVDGAANLQPSANACGQSCLQTADCSAFVYCPDPNGCDNGAGKMVEYRGCTLRQNPICDFSATCLPSAYQRGASVSFISGIVQKPDTTITQSSSNTSIPLGPSGCQAGAACARFGADKYSPTRAMCVPVPPSNTPVATMGGMCNDTGMPSDRTACPQNNTICNSTYLYGSTIDNPQPRLDDSAYKRLQADPFKPDPAAVAYLGTCVAVPVQKCGQLLGPCAGQPFGNLPSWQGLEFTLGDEDVWCPANTTCPIGSFCESPAGSRKAGYPWRVCLAEEPKCGQKEGKPCCYNHTDPGRPYCPANDLYCSMRAPLVNGLAKSKCLKEGDCGSLGRPCCEHSTWGPTPDSDVYNQEKAGLANDFSKCRDYMYCAQNKDGSPNDFINGTCTANPPNCGTKDEVCCFGTPDARFYTAYCDPGLICNTTMISIRRRPFNDGIGPTVALDTAYPTCIVCTGAEGSDPSLEGLGFKHMCSLGFDNTYPNINGGLADPTLKIRPPRKLNA